MDNPNKNCVYIDTNLNTRLVLVVDNHELISNFKEKLCNEHENSFPESGKITVSAIKVKRRGEFYVLPDSVIISLAFKDVKSMWFMYVDAITYASTTTTTNIVNEITKTQVENDTTFEPHAEAKERGPNLKRKIEDPNKDESKKKLASGAEEQDETVADVKKGDEQVLLLDEGKMKEARVELSHQNQNFEISELDSFVASGGINSVPSESRKKLLILDLNGLLADIVSSRGDSHADIKIGKRAVFKRPFCEDFLQFCFDKFEVGIWSSRKQNNVEQITEFLLGDLKSKLLFCWDMSHCATTTVGAPENKHKLVVFKDLNRLWEKFEENLPWTKGDYNETNTLMIDDSPYKALLNPPHTAIFPYTYSHKNKVDASLGDVGDLRVYLDKVADADNVQEFIKQNPFGQEAITEASESWDFFSRAINLIR